MIYKKLALALVAFFIPKLMNADDQPGLNLPSKENFQLFLLAGQSNMAGRGLIGDSEELVHARVLALDKDGNWKSAVAPIHYDKSVAGVGLGKAFAIALAEKNEDLVIGLIPAACGGSAISTWEPGGYHEQTKSHPYDDAIQRARRAMEDGVLKGILWHQGESDSKAELAEVYQTKLEDLIKRIRKDLGASSVPFVIGQLGRFPENPWTDFRGRVNQAHIQVAKEIPLVGFVSSEGLTSNSDLIHFDSDSLKVFGKRYAKVYLELVD